MTEKKTGYDYRVIVPELPSAEDFSAGGKAMGFRSLGIVKARTPEEAVEKAAAANLLEDGSKAVAVAVSHWHECTVAVESEPRVSATKVKPANPDGEIG